MKHRPAFTLLRPVAVAALLPAAALADSFGIGANTFDIDFVDITGGNVADDTGFGAVSYDFRMGTHEVSRGMIDAYNALGGGPLISLADMTSLGGNGPDRPATGVSWNEAARYVNWLNTSTGYSPAYNFTTGGTNDNITLWSPGDAGYDPANPFRNANALYFLPSEDEWYRAAYYDPVAGSYWDYATGSDTAPVAVSGGTAAGTAVYRHSTSHGPADVTNAGGLSPFGTMGQGGNVYELVESAYEPPNDTAEEKRLRRGGVWNGSALGISSASVARAASLTTDEGNSAGFRVASMAAPVPVGGSTALMLFIGLLGLVGVRRLRAVR